MLGRIWSDITSSCAACVGYLELRRQPVKTLKTPRAQRPPQCPRNVLGTDRRNTKTRTRVSGAEIEAYRPFCGISAVLQEPPLRISLFLGSLRRPALKFIKDFPFLWSTTLVGHNYVRPVTKNRPTYGLPTSSILRRPGLRRSYGSFLWNFYLRKHHLWNCCLYRQ